MRCALALMLLAGCSQLLGLDTPERIDASSGDDAPVTDAMIGDGRPDSALTATCPISYSIVTGLSTSRYRVSMNNASWDAAQTACLADQPMGSSRHTHLAVFTDDMELAALTSTSTNDEWIGLSDRVTEGTYVWVTDEVTAYPPASGPPWGTNEPQAGTTVNCVVLSKSVGQLKMQNCGNQRGYICECDNHANDATHY